MSHDFTPTTRATCSVTITIRRCKDCIFWQRYAGETRKPRHAAALERAGPASLLSRVHAAAEDRQRSTLVPDVGCVS
jgi:hypothetical protein